MSIKDKNKIKSEIIVSSSGMYELKIEFNTGAIGYNHTHSWKKVDEKKWRQHEDIFFGYNSIDGDSYGYEHIKWKEEEDKHILLLTSYCNWDDIVIYSDELDVDTDSFLKREYEN